MGLEGDKAEAGEEEGTESFVPLSSKVACSFPGVASRGMARSGVGGVASSRPYPPRDWGLAGEGGGLPLPFPFPFPFPALAEPKEGEDVGVASWDFIGEIRGGAVDAEVEAGEAAPSPMRVFRKFQE